MPMSLMVVITPLTVTVATAGFEDVQVKFPLPPVACNYNHQCDYKAQHNVENNESIK